MSIASSLESTSRFISLSSPVLSRFTSSSTCQPVSLIIPALIIHHFFTLPIQAQNLPFQQILPTLDFFYLLDCLHDNIHLYSPERQQQQVKKAPNTQQKQTNKREKKNYAQIGQASEQCYHQRTLKTSVNQR